MSESNQRGGGRDRRATSIGGLHSPFEVRCASFDSMRLRVALPVSRRRRNDVGRRVMRDDNNM